LSSYFLLLVSGEIVKMIVFRSYQERNRRLRKALRLNRSNTTVNMLTLLKPLACRYHSLILLSVDFRERSNMNKIATASLQTSGNILTNSRWPPRSHIENVISVFRMEIVFSMKLKTNMSNQVGPTLKIAYLTPRRERI
jgi:hypothetical protein